MKCLSLSVIRRNIYFKHYIINIYCQVLDNYNYIICELNIIKNELHLETSVLPRKNHRWAITHSYYSWPQVSWRWQPHHHHQIVKSKWRELMKMGEMKCVDLDGTARVGGGGTLVQDVTNLSSHLSAWMWWPPLAVDIRRHPYGEPQRVHGHLFYQASAVGGGPKPWHSVRRHTKWLYW